MSRIGKKPLEIPKTVTVQVSGRDYTVKGPKGEVRFHGPTGVRVVQEGTTLRVERLGESKAERAAHGLVRSVLENHVQGVVTPFTRILDIQGVGYGASLRKRQLVLKVGFANEVVLDIPEGLQVDLPSVTRIVVSGADKQLVGLFSAQIRRRRPPEPYNGKGIRYEGERVQRKAGKSFSSAG